MADYSLHSDRESHPKYGSYAPPSEPAVHERLNRPLIDEGIAVHRALMSQLLGELDEFRQILKEAGYVDHRIGEQRYTGGRLFDSQGWVDVAVLYAGGEFTVRVNEGTGRSTVLRSASLRLNQAVLDRDPYAVRTLSRVLVAVAHGNRIFVHRDAGGSDMGIECGAHLFGLRSVGGDGASDRGPAHPSYDPANDPNPFDPF